MLIISQEDVQILYILPVDTIKKEGRSSDLLRVRWNKEIGIYSPVPQPSLTSSSKRLSNGLIAREENQWEDQLL